MDDNTRESIRPFRVRINKKRLFYGKIFVNNFREFCLVWLLAKKGMFTIMFTQSKLELFSHSGAEVRKSREIQDRIDKTGFIRIVISKYVKISIT